MSRKLARLHDRTGRWARAKRKKNSALGKDYLARRSFAPEGNFIILAFSLPGPVGDVGGRGRLRRFCGRHEVYHRSLQFSVHEPVYTSRARMRSAVRKWQARVRTLISDSNNASYPGSDSVGGASSESSLVQHAAEVAVPNKNETLKPRWRKN